jgi:putative glutamine amidotransferase
MHRDWEPYDENRHEVELVEGSGLAALYPGVHTATINSVHHQSVKEVGDDIAVEARSTVDGVVEAVRLQDSDGAFVAGVQWHPEWVGTRDDLLPSEPLLRDFLDRARRRVS